MLRRRRNGIERQVGERVVRLAEFLQLLGGADFGPACPWAPRARTSTESATAPSRRGYAPCACPRSRWNSCRPSAIGRDRAGALIFAPALPSRSKIAAAAVAGSASTVLPLSASSAGANSRGPRSRTALPRCRTSSGELLRSSRNRSVEPSACRIANDSANGVWGTSAPRMLSSQQIESGMVITAASAPYFFDSSAMRMRLASAFSPASARPCGTALAMRRARLVAPHRIDGIGRAGHEFRARLGRRRLQAFHRGRGVQPRVVAELGAASDIGLDPRRRSLGHQIARLEQAHVGLLANLKRVAPVDEDRGLVGQHHGRARRAGEGGQPGQPLGAPRHIFALMLVGARHEETVEAALLEFAPEGRKTRGASRRVALVVVALEDFVHAREVSARSHASTSSA